MARKEYMVVDVVDILRRLQNGYSIRAVTRATGMDRNTLRKYLRLAYKKGFGRDGPCDLETGSPIVELLDFRFSESNRDVSLRVNLPGTEGYLCPAA